MGVIGQLQTIHSTSNREPAFLQVKGETLQKNNSNTVSSNTPEHKPNLRLVQTIENIDFGVIFHEISFQDLNGAKKFITVRRSDFFDTRELLRQLLDAGADIPPSSEASKSPLLSLQQSKTNKHIFHTSQIGFNSNTFVTPNGSFGADPNLLYKSQSADHSNHPLGMSRGDLEEFTNAVRPFLLKSRPARLLCCAQFASLLTSKIDVGETGIIHLSGGSGAGKSVAFRVAQAIVGRANRTDLEQFSGTVAGLEDHLSHSKNTLTILDDLPASGFDNRKMAQVFEALSYNSTNKKGRKLAKHFLVNSGTQRPTWNQFICTNAEYSVCEIFSRADRPVNDGVLRRAIDIYVGDGKATTICDIGHDNDSSYFASGLSLIQQTGDLLNQHFGAPLPIFIGWFQTDKNLQSKFECERQKFYSSFKGKYDDVLQSWQTAIVDKFSCLCASGLLAVQAGVFPVKESSLIYSMVKLCMDVLVSHNPNAPTSEELFKNFLEKACNLKLSPFVRKGDRSGVFDPKVNFSFIRRSGDDDRILFVSGKSLESHCGSKRVLRSLLKLSESRGILLEGSGKKLTQPTTAPGQEKPQRHYRFNFDAIQKHCKDQKK